MTKLLLIADDFTGTLDAGIQFSACGAETRVLVSPPQTLDTGAEVLAVNAASRHLPAAEAARIVGRLAAMARSAGIPFLFKKTDSALRGNVGAELSAALQAWGGDTLAFAPAYPALGRTTRNGTQYVDGVPLAQSAFGREALDPVRESYIPALLSSGTDVPVSVRTAADETSPAPGITVYDSQTERDLAQIAARRIADGETLFAGCAGFAGALAPLLGLRGHPAEDCPLKAPLLCVCGSLHPVTAEQVRMGEEAGFRRVVLPQGGRPEPFSAEGNTILTPARPGRTPSPADGARIAAELAAAAKAVLEISPDLTLFCTGGDTLLAVAEALGVTELEPVTELVSGVVLSAFRWRGERRALISKAGAFGGPDLLVRLAERTV